jgi:transportin-1
MQVHAILEALDGGQPELQEGVLSLLYKVAEDYPYQLDLNITAFGAKPADLMMPKIAALFRSERVDVRLPALRAFNILAQLMPAWLQENLTGYAQGLLALAREDSDSRMQKVCCC